jgi:hypothetical protein
MILRSKYYLARHSIAEKRVERFRDVVDEYYAFLNEFPESQYLKEAKNILSYSERVIARKGNLQDEDDLKELKKIKKEKETLLSDGKEIMSKKKRKSSKAD